MIKITINKDEVAIESEGRAVEIMAEVIGAKEADLITSETAARILAQLTKDIIKAQK